MNNESFQMPRMPRLNDTTFRKLGHFIHSKFGIKMPAVKKQMVESRLKKRLTKLGIKSYEDYCNFLFSRRGIETELDEFINQITTNKTDFFREPAHFSFMEHHALPALLNQKRTGSQKTIRVWCTACSSGHEPYTIAMVVSEFIRKNPGLSFRSNILGTDISTRVLGVSRKAVYDHSEIIPVSNDLRKKYLLRSKNPKNNLVRIVPRLRRMVTFRQLNLMSPSLDIKPGVDIVFCRNVMIYFDRKTQNRLLHKICHAIRPNGYLFMGHSEVIHDKSFPLVPVAPTIYKKIT